MAKQRTAEEIEALADERGRKTVERVAENPLGRFNPDLGVQLAILTELRAIRRALDAQQR